MNDRRGGTTELTILPSDLSRAAALFFPGAEAGDPIAGRDNIVRLRQDDIWWKVRCWPEGTSRPRLEFIHRVLARIAANDAELVPDLAHLANGETIVMHQGRLYDAQSWLAGHPAGGGPDARLPGGRWVAMPAVVPDAVFHNVLAAVARAHAAAGSLAAGDSAPVRPPLPELLAAVTEVWKAQRGVLRPIAARTPAVRRWLATGERALPAAEAAIAAASGPTGQAVNHFGLWPAHVLVADGTEQSAVTGLIGWEHCNIGSPLIDIVQAVSRFRGWTATGAEMAIAAYGEVLPLPPEERRLLPAVAALDLVASCGQMLIFAYGGPQDGPPPPAILREASRSLLESLNVATNALEVLGRPKKTANDRGRRPGADRQRPPKRKPRGPKKRR